MAAMLLVFVVPAAGAADECIDGFAKQLLKAEKLREMAAEAGAEWLETGKLLELAQAEAAEQNMDAACTLLAEAVFQAEAAIRQAEHEAGAWRDRAVK